MLLPYAELPVLFTACSRLSGAPGPGAVPGHVSEGCMVRFLLMGTDGTIWDSVLVIFEDWEMEPRPCWKPSRTLPNAQCEYKRGENEGDARSGVEPATL